MNDYTRDRTIGSHWLRSVPKAVGAAMGLLCWDCKSWISSKDNRKYCGRCVLCWRARQGRCVGCHRRVRVVSGDSFGLCPRCVARVAKKVTTIGRRDNR